MNTNNKLIPSAIKSIDNFLLKNKPVTWSSRIVPVLFLSIAFAAIIAVISFIVPNDPRQDTSVYYWIILLGIISLLGFIFWVIYLLRFNVFKRFGKWGSFDSLKTFIFYFIIISTIVAWPFIPPVIESARANKAYTTPELVSDVNNINLLLCQYEYDSIPHKLVKERYRIDTSMEANYSERAADGLYYEESTPENITQIETFTRVDSATFNNKLRAADSSVKEDDSTYMLLTAPEYKFVNPYKLSYNDDSPVLMNSFEIYNRSIKNYQKRDAAKVLSDLKKLLKKYETKIETNPYSYYTTDVSNAGQAYRGRVEDIYNLNNISNSISNIAEKKYRWEGYAIQISIRVLYYITLVLSLLVFAYRHVTRKTFFLSLLSGVILSILTSIFIATMRGDGESSFILLIVYFLIFLAVSLTVFVNKNRKAVTGIALNLALFSTSFLPLICMGYYYLKLHQKYSWIYERSFEEDYSRYFENEKFHFLLSEIGGFVLLVILIGFLYNRLYRKWYSLPEL